MSVDLWWEEDEKRAELYAGILHDVPLAILTKHKTYWDAWVVLVGVSTSRMYAPLEQHKAEIERGIQHWFGMANTSRPAVSDPSAE